MKTVSYACLVAAALGLGHLRLTAAENARFRYLAAVYMDDKGVGFNLPEGVACGAEGQVVVGDTGNDRLLRFTYRDNTVGGRIEVKIPQLAAPARIQLNSKREIYALDGKRRRIVHLTAGGEFKDLFAFDGVPAPATIVVKDFVIDPADNVCVLDVFSSRVLVLNAQGRFQRAVALPGDAGFVTGLAVGPAGNLVVIDAIKRRLFSAGKDAASFTPLGGDLSGALASMPTSITISKGVIFVAEGSGSRIAAFGQDGSFLSRQLTEGRDEGSLDQPSQICVNDQDEVFVADRDNSRIQVFRLIR